MWRPSRNLRWLISALGRGGDLTPVEDQALVLARGEGAHQVVDLGKRTQETLIPDPFGIAASYGHPTPLARVLSESPLRVPLSLVLGIATKGVVLAVEPPGLRALELGGVLRGALGPFVVPEAMGSVVVSSRRGPGAA